MGWLPMLLGEIPGHCNFGTLIVRRQWGKRVRTHDGAKASVVPGEIAAGLSDADILDAAVAINGERYGAVKRGGTAHAGIDRKAIPVGVNAPLCGLDIPTEARGKVTAALTEDIRTG